MNIHILVTSGKVEYKINNQTFIAKKGDLLFIPKDCIRSGKNFSQQVHEKYTILFRTSLMKNFDISFMNKQSCSFMKIANFEYYKQQFRLIYKEFKSREKYSQFIYEALLQELIFKIAREQEHN